MVTDTVLFFTSNFFVGKYGEVDMSEVTAIQLEDNLII